jgi:cytochrome c peroxidase
MKILKLAIIFVFVIALAASFLFRQDLVTGQTGGPTLPAPTGVTATDNLYNTKVGVYWDAIRGASSYRIFRNTTNNSAGAADVGSTAINFFFDAGSAPGQTVFYWVRAENGANFSDLSISDQGVRSGTPQQGPVPPLQPPPPAPVGNELTATKAYLGKALFWDEQMASTRTVACGTCHHSGTGGADPRSAASAALSTNPGPDNIFGGGDDIRGSAGVPFNSIDGTYTLGPAYALNDQVTGRKTVSYLNAAYAPLLFWDGRATGVFRDPITNNIVLNGGAALESQAAGPPVSSAEMAHAGRNWNEVASRIAASKPLALSPNVPTALNTWIDGRTYPDLFQEAFGSPEVTPSRIVMAIASFERTLFSDQAPVDIANAGITPLNAQEQRGRALFVSTSHNCSVCHGGNRFTDNAFHYIGVRPDTEDPGREQVTGVPNDRSAFRTPSLRNVGLRGSYFHNGRFTTLEEVVAFYNRGGDFDANNKPNLIHPLGLNTQEQADLVAFLRNALTDPRVAAETGPFDRPTLYMESNRVPQLTGAGRAGSGGFAPEIKAISPPIAGNPNFTVSVSKALGNANAVLVIDAADPGVGTTIPASGSFARLTTNTQNTGAGNGWASLSLPIPAASNIVGRTFFARWYIPDAGAANGFSVSQAARFTVFGEAAVGKAKFVDFDGDGRTDVSVFRPTDGNWYIHRSSDSTFAVIHWGIETDRLAPADYDGDQKTDVAVYRNGTWYLLKSRDGISVLQFGLPGDIPQQGDYDGDGIEDVAVYRPSDGGWYSLQSRDGFTATSWGNATDRPVVGDYDGDGRSDRAVYRDGVWWILRTGGGVTVTQFGIAEDKPVASDYDGDGKADIAVWRPSTGVWYHIRSSDGAMRGISWGLGTDIPSPGDYDGDGMNDAAVYRAGTWYLLNTTSGFTVDHFGLTQDQPVPSALVP